MINKSGDSDKYKFQQVRLRIRWVDYCRIRHIFPQLKNESAADYFRRFANWMRAFKVYQPKELGE